MLEFRDVELIYVADEVRRVVDGLRGQETPQTMSDRLAQAVWAHWTDQEAGRDAAAAPAARSGWVRRLTSQVGTLLVRGAFGYSNGILSRHRTERRERSKGSRS
jgi:hypothetical protein